MLLPFLAVLTLSLCAEVSSAPQIQFPFIRNGYIQNRLNHFGRGFLPSNNQAPKRYVSVPRNLQTFGMHARMKESPTLEFIFRQRYEGDDETRPIVLVDEPPILLIDQDTVTVAVGDEPSSTESSGSTTAAATTTTTTTEAINDET